MTTTERDPAFGNRHSAGEGGFGGQAAARAGPREGQSNSLRSAITNRDWSKVAKAFQPPEIWSNEQPPLRHLWLYIRHGKQLPAAGVLRVLSVGYGLLFGLPVAAVAYYVGWVAARPSRTIAGLILYVAAAHVLHLPWPSWLP